MTSGVYPSPPRRARSIRRVGIIALCMVGLFAIQSMGYGCYVLKAGNMGQIEQGLAPRSFGLIPAEPAMGSALPTPTLSRLAALSAPFQSFQASQVTKDPNCGRWGGRDKVRHGAIFFAATIGLQLFFESTFDVSKTEAFLISAAIGTLVGVSRELYDWRISDKDCFSEQDLLANTTGILAAGLVIMISN